MASKFGILAVRIIGSINYFVPDGTNIGTPEAPVLTGPTAKPADDADWLDYFIGRMQKAAYDPKKGTRERKFFSPTLRRYVTDTQSFVQQDAYNLTLIDHPAYLYDRLMYGLLADPVDDTPQQVFATDLREEVGWWRSIRFNEDKSVLCSHDAHGRMSIQTAPDDSEDISIPVLRWEHLGDATASLETIVFNPAA